jgi:hypothetical protein
MPLVAHTVDLPPEVRDVRAADADGDGRAELILVSMHPADRDPDRVTLTLIQVDGGAPGARSALDLGNQALLWEAAGGLFGVDGHGVWSLPADGGPREQLAELITPLAGIGPATPRQAPLARDIDGDGDHELMVFSEGKLLAFDAGGGALGGIPTPQRGGLAVRGGDAYGVTASTGTRQVIFGDMDGDGVEDLIVPAGEIAEVYFTGAVVGERRAQVSLPVDLEPRDEGGLAHGETEREIAERWFEDFDGDGLLDLAVMRSVMEGSWFGATSELLFCKGDGAGFGPPVVIPFEAAAAEPYPLDVDGDGDLDLVLPQVDVGVGNLVQALLSRSVSLQVNLLEMDGQFATTPRYLRDVDISIDPKASFLVQYRLDFTGDGIPDLLMGEEGKLSLYPGEGGGLAKKAIAEVAVEIPPQAELLVADFDGDGRAEGFLWGRRGQRGTLLSFQ